MKNRKEALELLKQYVENENLLQHCMMVAQAMEAYAKELGKSQEIIEQWWQAGLLHDIDWEKYPDEHPHKAVNEILPEHKFSKEVIEAVKSHAPERTGKEPETEIERYLFACDELSGFMNAVSLMRPNKFEDMKIKSVTKKLKDHRFAANVPREDIQKGAELIGKSLQEHIRFMIQVYQKGG